LSIPSGSVSGSSFHFNQCNLECGAGLETLRDFTSVSSDFYPGLALHYRKVIEEWYLARFFLGQKRLLQATSAKIKLRSSQRNQQRG
jgi:hypothetical protein